MSRLSDFSKYRAKEPPRPLSYPNDERDVDERFPERTIRRGKMIAKLLEHTSPEANYLKVLHDDVMHQTESCDRIHEGNAWRVVRTAYRQFTDNIPNWQAFEERPPYAEEIYASTKPFLDAALEKQMGKYAAVSKNSGHSRA